MLNTKTLGLTLVKNYFPKWPKELYSSHLGYFKIKNLIIVALNFNNLWSSYPKGRVQGSCASYKNQCAIKLSEALAKSGIDVSQEYKSKNTCMVNDITHIRGAETLALHLNRIYKRRLKYIRPHRAKILLKNKKGIIFFKDIIGFRNGIGDHIDLWNGIRTKSGAYWNSCQEVWFWEVR